jgi:hypothetical protein
MTGFPKLTRSMSTGETGVNLIATIVNRDLGWIFRRNHAEHDFGIDGYIDIVTGDGFVTGRCLAVQIKFGASYVARKQPYGYSYVGEAKHLNYLVNHPLPVLLLIGDPETTKFYWTPFNPDAVVASEQGWTISVPYDQVFDASAAASLVALAGPAHDYGAALDYHSRLNGALQSADVIFCPIARSDIETQNYRDTVRVFERLAITPEFARSNQGKVELFVDGYDDDSRELWQIPEAVLWMRAIESQIKYWFYFLCAQENAQALRTFTYCVCGAQFLSAVKYGPGEVPLEMDGTLLVPFLERNLAWLNEIAERLSLPESEIQRIGLRALACIGFELSEGVLKLRRTVTNSTDAIPHSNDPRKRKRRRRKS